MSGERTPIPLLAEEDSVLTRSVAALGRFPRDASWVLIGGIAVFLRLGSVTRVTADADTIARSQALLLDRLAADPTTIISGGNVQMSIADHTVDIDVTDVADEPLPDDIDRRPFALARRSALATATAERVVVTHPSTAAVLADAVIPVATTGALVALKAVSIVRRPHSTHPEKVGSDIHDMVRLVAGNGATSVAGEVLALEPELAAWVADYVDRAFGSPDLRYTLLRLRRYDRSPGAEALSDGDVAATAILADAIRDGIDPGEGRL